MQPHDIEQRSEAWSSLRLGKLTASRISDALARTKTGWGSGRANLIAELVLERLTGRGKERFVTPAMQHGIDTEAEARIAYGEETLSPVLETGFHEHPTIPLSGASPDGLIGEVGLVEIKCCQPAAHLDILRTGKIPEKYRQQMLWQLACCPGREWNDFAAYNPDFPEGMRLYIQRIDRDDAAIAEMEEQARVFLAEVAAAEVELRETYHLKEAA